MNYSPGRVYVLREPHGAIKVGWTSLDPESRLRVIQRENPWRLALIRQWKNVGDETVEQRLLAHLRDAFRDDLLCYTGRRNEGEWFSDSPAIVEAIDAYATENGWRAAPREDAA